MIFAGADPGLRGALAFLNPAGQCLALLPTPVGADGYDLDTIARVLWSYASVPSNGGLVLTVEKLRALPATKTNRDGTIAQLGGFKTNLARGESRGWLWMVAGMRACGLSIECRTVEPQTWHKELMAGFPLPPARTRREAMKARSIAYAKLTWPGVSLYRTERSRIEDDNLAEALLLAELGRRRAMGGALFAARGA